MVPKKFLARQPKRFLALAGFIRGLFARFLDGFLLGFPKRLVALACLTMGLFDIFCSDSLKDSFFCKASQRAYSGLLGWFLVQLLRRFLARHPGSFFAGLSGRLVALAGLNRGVFAGLLGWILVRLLRRFLNRHPRRLFLCFLEG